MNDIEKFQLEELLQSAPGGIAKLAFDDMLTILFATDTFYKLIQNVTDKVVTKTPTALLRIVYSADIIYVTQQLALQKNRTDNMIRVNFRTLKQDGSFRWVMITGNRMEEVFQSGTKTVSVYSCIAVDITDHMIQYKKMEQTADYQRTITELSKDLYFEYEIATDTLSFSELFREIFGKDAVMTGFRHRLEKAKIIHPEELPAVIGIFNSMMSGRKQVRFELRMITKEKKPCWYICYAAIIFDENRNPYKVVGKLSTTNPINTDIIEQKYIPQMDSLTNVCTKESTEIMIKEANDNLNPESLCTLMIVEIRNYKNMNEVKKTINSENILTAVGQMLKSQLRSSDIIGRVGIGEFVIYAKDIASDITAYNIAEQICKKMENLFSYSYTKNGVAVSIGMTLQKGKQEYQTLVANANAALVIAKKVPVSSFEIFNGTINS
jgi:diguanylate cyclase (GGDEF)-like protein